MEILTAGGPVAPERGTDEAPGLVELLSAQARKRPDDIAVEYRDETLTFAELVGRATELAAGLRSRGLRRDDCVGIFLEPSAALPVAVWGVLFAGAAYLPLSPDYPDERIRAMAEDSRAPVLLTEAPLRDRLAALAPPGTALVTPAELAAGARAAADGPAGAPAPAPAPAPGSLAPGAPATAPTPTPTAPSPGAPTLAPGVPTSPAPAAPSPGAPPLAAPSPGAPPLAAPSAGSPAPAAPPPGALAYVIYTSGSTGRPKGVMVEHRAIAHQMRWLARTYGLGPSSTVLQKTPMSFDAAQWEILAPCLGSRIVPAAPGAYRDPGALLDTVVRHGVTVMQCVPTLLQALLDTDRLPDCDTLTQVFCGGEALSRRLAQRFTETLHKCELVNLYGPTECTVNASACTVDPSSVADGPSGVPIGTPVDGLAFHVLDERMRPVAPGAVGELYISGVQVARGYRHRPDLTAERFLDNPFSTDPAHAVLYRTGDRVHREGGTYRFDGRVDRQVKLRGYRVELDEIRLAIETHDWVRNAAVLVKDDPASGHRSLVACVELSPREAALMDQGSHDRHHVSKAGRFQVRAQLSDGGCRDTADLAGRHRVDLPGRTPTAEQCRRVFARKTYRFYEGGETRPEELLALLAARTPGAAPRRPEQLRAAELGAVLRYFGQYTSDERLLPKYGYASPGSLYAAQLYLEVTGPDGCAGLAPGHWYYHPVEHRVYLIEAGSDGRDGRGGPGGHDGHSGGGGHGGDDGCAADAGDAGPGGEAGPGGPGGDGGPREDGGPGGDGGPREDGGPRGDGGPGIRFHFAGRRGAIAPVYRNNVQEVLEIEAGHMAGLLEEVLPAYGLDIAEAPHTPGSMRRLHCAEEDHYLGAFDLVPYRADRPDVPVDVYLQVHPGRVPGMAAGQYHHTGGALERIADELVLKRHVIAINQQVYERAAFGITLVSPAPEHPRSYLDLGRRLQRLQMNGAGFGFMPSGYSSRTGHDLPAARRMEAVLRAAGRPTGPSYFFVGGRVSAGQLAHRGMREDSVHMRGPTEMIRADLVELLPDYMVPHRLVVMDRLPLTASGKVDLRALESAPETDFATAGRPFVAPSTTTERIVRDLWQAGTGQQAASIRDDFFECGGNSLIAVGLVNRVNRRFGCALPLQVLFESPTIEELARRVDGQRGASSSRLVPLGAARAGRPVYCWPGLGGYPMNLRPLARRLDAGRPFLGIQAHGVNAGEQPYATITEMAGRDVRAITEVQPNGPYTLCGYSFGARVAFETAHLLEREGHRVDRLLLLAPGSPKLRTAGSGRASYTDPAYLTILYSVFAGAVTGPGLEACLRATTDEESFVSHLTGHFDGLDREMVRRITAVVRQTYDFGYTFGELRTRRVEAPVTVVKAAGDDYSFLDGSTGWSATEPRVHQLGSGHYDILREPGVAELARLIGPLLARTD
ncbi:amino acid adenylation protein [Streptomyces spongiicola]|uniref:Amino acid adenylation protein n=1 Tax=Streptomyces spongiicola TaxID=1690221 RepID=A0ABN5KQ13_9ACTN|nr:AMP-binding protein [Streptomyces spongiicola]AWK10725.1 amino acid adenylation protein [Streptomyces spongiicola]